MAEEETSFIVLNPAEEVTEERSSGRALEEQAPTVVKCCERGVEVADEEGEEHTRNRSKITTAESEQDTGNGLEWLLWRSGLEVGLREG